MTPDACSETLNVPGLPGAMKKHLDKSLESDRRAGLDGAHLTGALDEEFVLDG